MKPFKCALAAIALLLGDFAFAHKVIGISDGDTITLLVDNKPLKIRLANIDAPEKKQAFGQKSKESLSDICWNKDATFETQTIDRYGRAVAIVLCNGIEAKAREQKIGLWNDHEPVAPWEFRLANKNKHNSNYTK